MKVAVVGGNLLGCATVLNLAVVDEANGTWRADHPPTQDQQQPQQNIEVTLFERTNRLGGNSLKSTQIDHHLKVEVGSYRTLPLVPDTHLHELVEIANDRKNTISILGQSVKLPGSKSTRRGRRNAVPTKSLWKSGTYRRVVRSFATWDWEADVYNLKHSGWPVLNFIYRILDNAIWRSIALAGFFRAYQKLMETHGNLDRTLALAQVIFMLILVLMSPKNVIASLQNQYSFWGTTLTLLFRYGITPAIARGSTIGFTRLLSEIKSRRLSNVSATIGTLVDRCGLENYLRGTGDDFVRIFKYNRKFVHQFLASTVAIFNYGSSLSQVSSLATHLALLDGDEYNSDAHTRISTLEPHNAALCTGLILAARATTDVDLRYNADVKVIKFDYEEYKYQLTLANGTIEKFDGVVLCASPRNETDLKIETQRNSSLHELLGYNRNLTAKLEFEEQEENYRTENEVDKTTTPIENSACSHFAVVVGQLDAAFFRFADEKYVPDLVQINHAPGFSRVERIRETNKDLDGVYTVVCGSEFQTDGTFSELFKEGSVVRYFEALPKNVYSLSALPEGKSIDDCCPPIVFGPKFIYAAAMECLAKHPEIDAIAASNAASFFSRRINWSTEEEDENTSTKNEAEEGIVADEGIDKEVERGFDGGENMGEEANNEGVNK